MIKALCCLVIGEDYRVYLFGLRLSIFFWRACRDCLPTCSNLRRCGVDVPMLCLFCERNLENNWHFFISCSFAASCWEEANLFQLVEPCSFKCESFIYWFLTVLSKCDEAEAGKFTVVIWNIWRQHKDEVWRKSHLSPTATAFTARQYLCEWIEARQHDGQRTGTMGVSIVRELWHVPSANSFKCSVDASLFQFGMVVRDDVGAFLVCRYLNMDGSYRA